MYSKKYCGKLQRAPVDRREIDWYHHDGYDAKLCRERKADEVVT